MMTAMTDSANPPSDQEDDDEADSPFAHYVQDATAGDETGGDQEDLAALMSGATVVGIHSRLAAQYLAAGTEALSAALEDRFSLLTADDANKVVAALRRQITAAGVALEQVSVWLQGAHERGELPDPASTTWRLDGVKAMLAQATAPFQQFEAIDGDPVLSMLDSYQTLADAVTESLRKRDIVVVESTVGGDWANWMLLDGGTAGLQVSSGMGWTLAVEPEDGSDMWDVPSIGLPLVPYAHPDHVAEIVAAYVETQKEILSHADTPPERQPS